MEEDRGQCAKGADSVENDDATKDRDYKLALPG
jgi:hypothetical protein